MASTLHAAALERLPAKTVDPQCMPMLNVRRLLGVAIAEVHIDRIVEIAWPAPLAQVQLEKTN